MAPQEAGANCQSKNRTRVKDAQFSVISLTPHRCAWQLGGMLFDTLELLASPLPSRSAAGPVSFGAALNMAVDEVLLVHAQHPVLRVYGWARQAVSFGYFEPWTTVNAVYPPPAWDLVRRWTGGGVVVHGQDWTYSLIVPRSDAFAHVRARESYLVLHQLLADAMASAGVGSGGKEGVSLAAEAAAKISEACFENPAQHDLLLAGQKVAGAGQHRSRAGMLHQGSVQGVAIPPGFADQWARRLAATVVPRTLSQGELAEARSLAAGKYATAEWNRRF